MEGGCVLNLHRSRCDFRVSVGRPTNPPTPFTTKPPKRRAKLEAEERHLRRNYQRAPYAHPLLDKYLGEATFEGKRWHALVGVGSVVVNVVLVLMVWALQGAVVREREKRRKGE